MDKDNVLAALVNGYTSANDGIEPGWQLGILSAIADYVTSDNGNALEELRMLRHIIENAEDALSMISE